MEEKILSELKELSEDKYQEFSKNLSPGVNIMGVRLPALRKLSKKLLKEYGSALLLYHLKENSSFEEKFIYAYALASISIPVEKRLSLIRDFLPYLDGWAIVDSFCTMLKDCKAHQDEYFSFIGSLFESNHSFTARFAIVMCNSYFVDERYMNDIFSKLEKADTSSYYVHMAVSWVIASFYCKYKTQTISWLLSSKIEIKTFNKAISKMIESLIPTNEEKAYLKTLKRKA